MSTKGKNIMKINMDIQSEINQRLGTECSIEISIPKEAYDKRMIAYK